MGGFSNVFDCVRDEGHEGSHRSFGGSEWDEPTPHDSENADDPLAGNPYDLDADELAPNGRRDETPIDAEEPIESVFRT
ncbi:MAG: hypothetical protein RJQ01_08040 [Microcella sp.]|uniref:hypothetical protein n=1 Tax=Microcella sp. TaxID=1913979 RepID=UPI003315FB54